MPTHTWEGQSTDKINSAPLVKAVTVQDDVRSKSLSSVQTLSGGDRAEAGGVPGADAVGAKVQAGR